MSKSESTSVDYREFLKVTSGGVATLLAVFLLGCVEQSDEVEQARDTGWNLPNKSDQRVTGAYDVVKGWPKELSDLPGHEGWTWGAVQGVFAQNPDRVFVTMRGELRKLPEDIPAQVIEIEDGAGGTIRLTAPVRRAPARNPSLDPMGSPGEPHWPSIGEEGRDYRWEHVIFVVDREGEVAEWGAQWNSMFKRVHKIRISPYDPEKRVWVIDDAANAIYIFSNDGEELLQTLGTPGEHGNDESHFFRQTDVAWLPEGTFLVADGYENTRVVKFGKEGDYLTSWGEPAEPGGNEKRPNHFNEVHSIAIDAERRVYVSDRANRRIQVFDENGSFIDQWYLGDINTTYDMRITADQHLWTSDGHGNYKIQKYSLDGEMLLTWGSWGPKPGQLWGVHQMSVDQEGSLYVAEVLNARVQKFVPREGGHPDYLIGIPAYPTWQE